MNICTRSEAKTFVKKGFVTVNGVKANDPGLNVNPDKDLVFFKDNEVKYSQFEYYMLNKPAGYVTATKDREKCVMDLFKDNVRKDLFPVGRLDKDTVGLLVVTNDGELAHKLLSPKRLTPKKYFAQIRKPLSEEDISTLKDGVLFKKEDRTAKCEIEVVSDLEIILTLTDGMYHEVKRLLLSVDNEVLYLKRISMNGLMLDESIPEGNYRALTDDEIKLLKGEV